MLCFWSVRAHSQWLMLKPLFYVHQMLRLSPYPLSALVSTIHSRAHGHSCNFSPVELKVWLVYHRNLLLITRTKPTRSNNSTRQGSFIWSRFGRAFVGSTGQGLRSIILNHFHPLENCDYLSHAPWCSVGTPRHPIPPMCHLTWLPTF